MFRKLRSLAFILLGAALGAAAGRIALQARQNIERGDAATAIDFSQVTLRMQDVVPGVVAAFRVGDAPWSWFHIPGWFAAFVVNTGVGAVGGDITKFREQAERTAFGLAGLDARDFGLGGADEDVIDGGDSGLNGHSTNGNSHGFSGPAWDPTQSSTPGSI